MGRVGSRGQTEHSPGGCKSGRVYLHALSSKDVCDSDRNSGDETQGTQASTESQDHSLKPIIRAPYTLSLHMIRRVVYTQYVYSSYLFCPLPKGHFEKAWLQKIKSTERQGNVSLSATSWIPRPTYRNTPTVVWGMVPTPWHDSEITSITLTRFRLQITLCKVLLKVSDEWK